MISLVYFLKSGSGTILIFVLIRMPFLQGTNSKYRLRLSPTNKNTEMRTKSKWITKKQAMEIEWREHVFTNQSQPDVIGSNIIIGCIVIHLQRLVIILNRSKTHKSSSIWKNTQNHLKTLASFTRTIKTLGRGRKGCTKCS